MGSSQSPTANGPGQLPEPPYDRERDAEEPPVPGRREDQGREVPGFNHEGYKEADVVTDAPAEDE